MTSTFDKVADIISQTSEIDRDTITPKSHTIDDLGILRRVVDRDVEGDIGRPLIDGDRRLPAAVGGAENLLGSRGA